MKSLGSAVAVLLLFSAGIVPSLCTDWEARFDPNKTIIVIDEIADVHLILSNLPAETSDTINRYFVIKSENEQVAVVDNPDEILFRNVAGESGQWETHFRVKGVFLGTVHVFVERRDGIELERSNEVLDVIVSRPERLLDTLFAVIVVLLLAILFINFGAAIDLKSMKDIFRRPIGPAIGTVCQLALVPLIAYGLGLALFPNDPGLALGLFLTGISPAGGASNIWTLLCGGNINLSISMTTISTLACFGTIPLWLYLLGRSIFDRANLGVPYTQVTLIAISLLVPLAIGLLIQRFLPKLAKFLVKYMEKLSLLFLIIIVVLGIFTNSYMMPLFGWEIFGAGLGLPLLGNILGLAAAAIFRQPIEDCIAISIEIGVQNTALTLFLLTFSLEPPTADIAMIIPIAVSILTPVPMVVFIVVKKVLQCLKRKKPEEVVTVESEMEKVTL
ncbi:ileal sodium/bile acid cotransporter-like [Bradysia coprophila]|uniref:ileal sodium/bile acid cotransporter-like n=1 Tax=Bradysia coprophila TaxID=38358 RepID=UPI00187D7450|nr:ileal sodium/bile acid cotransporter-like [Bradysia coprophila]